MKRSTSCFAVVLLLFTIRPLFGGELKVLHGHVPDRVTHLPSKGRLPASNELWLAIGVPLRDEVGLEKFVADISDPTSQNFRHYLTRDQLTDRFGPTEQDYDAVKRFAETNGMTIKVTHANRLLLDVVAPVSAIEKAFHVTMRTYAHPTEARDFYAPDTEPTVDVSLPVVDVLGLTDFAPPHPRLRSSAVPRANGNGSAPDGSGDLFGDDFRKAYMPNSSLNGAGQIVGLLEFNGYFTNDIYNYAVEAGGGRTNIVVQTVLLDGYSGKPSTGIRGGEVEVELDIEMAMAIAPGLAKIISYEAGSRGNQNDILNAMLANSNVLNLSCSWGWSGPSATTDAIFKSMDAVGQTFFNASGDEGAFTTGSNSVNGVDNPALLNSPSSNPFITQVGGTTLTLSSNSVAYGSEVVWNWGSGSASSGGISSFYPIPAWQTNVSDLTNNGGSTQFRNIPDVAANADNVYVLYSNGKATDGIGGTSVAAPLWAGYNALVNQQLAANGRPGVGFINPALYNIAVGTNYTACFHDIMSGNNETTASPSLFTATNGYDLCTGLGTMNGASLINALAFPAAPPPVPAPTFRPLARGSNSFILSWNAVATRSYQVQYKRNLLATNWVNLGAPIAASNSVATLSDSFTNTRRFYRVQLLTN